KNFTLNHIEKSKSTIKNLNVKIINLNNLLKHELNKTQNLSKQLKESSRVISENQYTIDVLVHQIKSSPSTASTATGAPHPISTVPSTAPQIGKYTQGSVPPSFSFLKPYQPPNVP